MADIFSAMTTRQYIGIVDGSGVCHIGMVTAVMAEDGSGKNFIVKMAKRNLETASVFIRAAD